MREKGTSLNTHIKTAKGYLCDGERIYNAEVDIRCTADSHETLSLQAGNILIQVGVNEIEDVIAEARNDKGETE